MEKKVKNITPEMVEAAEEAYMPFGDMEMALTIAFDAYPEQDEKVFKLHCEHEKQQLIDENHKMEKQYHKKIKKLLAEIEELKESYEFLALHAD